MTLILQETVNLSISAHRMRCSMKVISWLRALNFGAKNTLTVTSFIPFPLLLTCGE